jgi:AraC-like DNA-binding protein
MNASSILSEQSKFWRLPELGNLELLRATFVTQSFPRHTHDSFAVGVIEQGALGFYYRGENVVASQGTINLANPDEAHTGYAAAETGWTYRMFYLDANILQKVAAEIADRPIPNLPFFQAGVLQDDELARAIHQFHRSLESNAICQLEKESRLLWMLTQLIIRHADAPPTLSTIGREDTAVERARDYIEAYYDDDISIDHLAAVANLSRFHFIRVFRYQMGLTPHAYLTQVRVKRAKDFLVQGWSISATAAETGFVDQSHLTRHFKRIMGVTPGQYRNIVQDR